MPEMVNNIPVVLLAYSESEYDQNMSQKHFFSVVESVDEIQWGDHSNETLLGEG